MLPRPRRSFKSTYHITSISPITTPYQKMAHETNIQNQTFPLKLMLPRRLGVKKSAIGSHALVLRTALSICAGQVATLNQWSASVGK
ncbi:hypothetical protein C3414_02110 [Serratia sp. SSNIH2]|nr:hypothetical protein C3F38_07975 [Serratia sp. SSNIH1]POU57238.1 hypothetical protein C3401_02110 [Serratia sp. SSNIH4]POW34463.1 hypothetical protein C3396_20590 [Serratia sp. SSNIH5]POW44095.1 hypothetical protein C3414_02110 [Serratia sp. SSNIH2]POW51528.1 hypothetical protein C3403_22855 [Serratia sp. SSNIH3]